MRKFSLIAVLSFAMIFAADTLAAQTDTHVGFYGSVGIGYGAQTTSLDFGEGDAGDLASQETTWYVGIGLGVKPQWAFGIDFNYMKAGCNGCGGGTHLTNSFYTAAATYYPNAKGNWFFKLNLGYVQNEASFTGGSDSEGGFAAGLGFGYDWVIGKGGFIVKPFANYFAQVSSSTYSGAESFSGAQARAQLLQIGLGIGYKH